MHGDRGDCDGVRPRLGTDLAGFAAVALRHATGVAHRGHDLQHIAVAAGPDVVDLRWIAAAGMSQARDTMTP